MLGTLRYMAPELFEGKAHQRSDVYSLGLTLYELLALRPTFDENDGHLLVRQVLDESPPRLPSLNPSIPRELANDNFQLAVEKTTGLRQAENNLSFARRALMRVGRADEAGNNDPAVAPKPVTDN